ncbi:PREDICTED: probable cytochrome P450 28a5 [Drosophila arizonae]|uniref:Probable cytochrome P450 28a5 n=1 Tax=Drosophila arizonae TaxID=7263 RepID=A0ABM1NNI5_DROAR|nr:PREDICTED: probable cytochrome P450 28a5 [Drosophila arizonae]
MLTTLALLALVALLGYEFLIWNYSYWRKRKVPGPKPALLTGNYPNLFTMKQHPIFDLNEIYNKYKQQYDAVGIYMSRMPQLLIVNPELAHRVFVSHFKHFHDNEMSTLMDEKTDFLIANNIFSMAGNAWKERRSDLTPGLTISRIKSAYPVTMKVCKKMNEFIHKQIRIAPKDGINGKDVSLCFTSEMVTDCVLGLSAQSFTDRPTPVMANIKTLFEQPLYISLSFAVMALLPSLRHVQKWRFVPKDVERFFVDFMGAAIDARSSQVAAGQLSSRMDFLDYIQQLAKRKNLSTRQVTACSMTFLLDGFETTATILAHTLLLLGRDARVQQRLRDELKEHLNDEGSIDFDKLVELPYLNACVHECIRLFPPLAVSNKVCTEPIELPNKNGPNFKVEKGTIVVVPHGCYMLDEDIFPNAKEFQPERFEDPSVIKAYRDKGAFMGFGDGPRICIGMRFALTQIKAALAEIIVNFDVSVNPKTRKDNMFQPGGLVTTINGGIWLDFAARS